MTDSPFRAIRAIDYTVIFARDMAAMQDFYGGVMGFPKLRELSVDWIEYGVGGNTLALARRGLVPTEPPPEGSAALQLAFRVPPGDVARCAEALEAHGIALVSPVTDRDFGHRTLFFRDPDGNLLEVYAEI